MQSPPQPLAELMLSVGWCPSEIANLDAKFEAISGLLMVARMRPATAASHARCDKSRCLAYQIDSTNYKTKHVCHNGFCGDYQDPKLDSNIRHILQKSDGGLPILRITGSGPALKVAAVQATPSKPYVAISHIWADGLGNPSANTLPVCQLERL